MSDDETARAAVAAGDADALVTALAGLSDKRRRELREPLRDLLRRRHRLPAAIRQWPDELQTLDLVLEVGTCPVRDVSWGWWRLSRDPDLRGRQLALTTDVLAARPRSAHRALVRGVCEPDGAAAVAWPVLRELRRRGVVEDADATADALAVGVVRAVWSLVLRDGEDWRDPPDDVLVRSIDEDPEIAGLVLHGLGTRAALDAAHGPWAAWVATAVTAGALDRAAVLATVLRAQDGDARPSTATLLCRIVDGLDPTTEELEVHQRELTRILADGHPTARRQAARQLERLAATDRLSDPTAVAAATGAALSGRQKAAATAALRLLAALDASAEDVAAAAAAGLSHVHPDVQGRALDLLEGHLTGGSPPSRIAEAAALHVDVVAPEHRDRVAALAGVEELVTTPPTVRTDSTEVLRHQTEELPAALRSRLGLDERLQQVEGGSLPAPADFRPADVPSRATVPPVTDPEELGELLGFLLGGSATALDLERAIDGLARLDARRAPPHVTATVVRLAGQALQTGMAGGGGMVGFLVAQLGHDWAAGRAPSPLDHLRPTDDRRRLARLLRRGKAPGRLLHDLVTPPRASHDYYSQPDGGAGLAGFLAVVQGRLLEAVVISRAGPRPTIALPTDDAGWIDEDEFVARVAELEAAGRTPGRFEAVAALLRLRDPGRVRRRLPTDGPTGAVAAAVDGADNADPALRRALGHRGTDLGPLTLATGEERPGLVRTTPWFAVPEVPTWRRDDPVGQLLDEVQQRESRHATSWWNTTRNVLPEADRFLLQWAPLAVPWGAHLLAAAATRAVLVDPDADRSSSGLDAFVGRAGDPDVPLPHPWPVLLAAALLANNRITGITAADVVAAAATDGRLDAGELGAQLARLHRAGVGAANRVVDRLGPVVEADPLVAAAVRRALQRWVALVDGLPRDLHHLYGLLELACTHSAAGVDDPAARAALQAATSGRSRRATTAVRLLDRPAIMPQGEAAGVLAGQLARARRWHEMTTPGDGPP